MARGQLSVGLISRTIGVEEPSELVTMRRLRLNGLRLSRLCSFETFAGSLQELYLSANQLERLDELLSVASSLVVLSVAQNRLRTLSLANFERLRIVDASANQIGMVAPDDLPINTLTILDLRSNPCCGQCEEAIKAEARNLTELNGIDLAAKPPKFATVRVPIIQGGKSTRMVPLRYDVDGDLESIARAFCDDHAVDANEDVVHRLVDVMTAAAESPSFQERPERSLDQQIQHTYENLLDFEHNFLVNKREPRRNLEPKRPLSSSRRPESDDLRQKHHGELVAQRHAFAHRIREKIDHIYQDTHLDNALCVTPHPSTEKTGAAKLSAVDILRDRCDENDDFAEDSLHNQSRQQPYPEDHEPPVYGEVENEASSAQ